MEEDLVAALLADAGLAALVGRRVNWMVRPRASALPAVVLQVVSAPETYTFQGRSRLAGHLVQADCWALTYLEAKWVARAATAAFDGMTLPPFFGCFVEGGRDLFEAGSAPQPPASAAADGGLVDFYRASLDIRVWRRNAA